MTIDNVGKHPGHIVAIENKYLDTLGLQEGFNKYDAGISRRLREEANGSITISRRRELDAKGSVIPRMQLLPYVIVRQQQRNGQWAIFVYNRTKLIGEDRLVGNSSIGLGGHVDGVDIVWGVDLDNDSDSVFNFEGTVRSNIRREILEELEFTAFTPVGDDGGVTIEGEFERVAEQGRIDAAVEYACATARPSGYLFDHSDDVGKYHLGLTYVLDIPAHIQVRTKAKFQADGSFAPELETVGFLTVDQLVKSHLPFESWSKLLIADMDV